MARLFSALGQFISVVDVKLVENRHSLISGREFANYKTAAEPI